MAYGLELRERVIGAWNHGEYTQVDLADVFGISISTLKRWLCKVRHGEGLEPKSNQSGRPRKIDEKGEETIKQLVRENPSITLKELSKAYYKRHKIRVDKSILSRSLQELNLRYKKLSVKSVEKETLEVQKKRKNIYRK